MPCAIHFSGNTDATFCIQAGRSLNTKNTPEMNCSTRTIGRHDGARGLRPSAGPSENATPQTRPGRRCRARTPTRSVSPAPAVVRQSGRRTGSAASRQQQRGLHERGDQHLADLAEEERRRRQRRAAQPLEAAVVALDGDRDREVWKLDSMMPVATHPGQEVLRERDPGGGATSAPSCPNTVAKIASMMIGYAKMKTTASRSRKNCCTS